MKSIVIFLLGTAFSYLNAVFFMDYCNNPIFKLGVYLGLGLMLYPIVNRTKVKRKRGYVH